MAELLPERQGFAVRRRGRDSVGGRRALLTRSAERRRPAISVPLTTVRIHGGGATCSASNSLSPRYFTGAPWLRIAKREVFYGTNHQHAGDAIRAGQAITPPARSGIIDRRQFTRGRPGSIGAIPRDWHRPCPDHRRRSE